MNRRAAAPLVAVVLALSACAFDSHRVAHPPSLDAASMGIAAAAGPPLAERWWQAFGDPQLDELMTQATRDSPTLAEALARLQKASADALVAGAARMPHVDASATVLRERFSALYVIPPPYGGGSYWDGQLDLGLTYDLDFWGRQSAQIRAAERIVSARSLDAQAAALAIRGALASAYVELDRRYALADLAREAEAARAQVAALTGRRADAGLDTGIERHSADAALPDSRADRAQAVAAVELGVHRLAALAGHGAAAYDGIGRPQLSYGAELPLPAVIPADLLVRRPDIQAARARVEAASAAEDAARLAAYPDINLQAFVGFAALSLKDLLSAPARTYGIGPSVRLPIFDAGALRARFRGAGADLDSAVAQYNATVVEAVREAADALSNVAALDRAVQDADRHVALMIEAQRLAAERYRAGLSNRIAVLDADTRVIAARRTFVTVRALAAEARIALVVALGGGTPALASSAASAMALP